MIFDNFPPFSKNSLHSEVFPNTLGEEGFEKSNHFTSRRRDGMHGFQNSKSHDCRNSKSIGFIMCTKSKILPSRMTKVHTDRTNMETYKDNRGNGFGLDPQDLFKEGKRN